MGRWILWGWVALAVIVVGLVLGFVLYTRIVIGIGLQDQRALLHLPETLIVQTRALELRAASARMEQRVLRGEELLAQVDIVAAFVTPEGRPRRQPEEWRRAFERFALKDHQ